MAMRTIDADATERAAKLFHSFSDPVRLAILLELLGGERRVTDLVSLTGRSQSTVSAHLACLRGCGLVTVRPQGRQSFHALSSVDIVDFLLAAQRLLAATGEQVLLCPERLGDPS